MESVAMGALINANDRFGHSPLHYAAYRGNAYIVDYLLRHGGNPNTRGNHLSTPLHSAAWGKNQKVVELLLEDGAEVDAQTDEHETPIMTATLRGQVETVETLLALSADPHAVDKYGSNLMDLAGASGNKKLVQLFKKLGVKASYPLHLAAGTGDFASIKSLLEDGRSINEQDSFGATPLLVATVAGREDMVIYLLEHSADPQIEAKDGYSLLHGAAFSGKKSLVRMMLAHGLKSAAMQQTKSPLLMWERKVARGYSTFALWAGAQHGNWDQQNNCPDLILSAPKQTRAYQLGLALGPPTERSQQIVLTFPRILMNDSFRQDEQVHERLHNCPVLCSEE